MTLVLNEKQKLAIDKINEFVSQDEEKIFYLMGYAGTGKTFLIGKAIKELLLSNKMDHIFVCAPTHKALKVIESYLKSNLTPPEQVLFLPKLSFMTIHKLLEFKPIIVAEDGSKVFKSTKESKFLKQMENKLIVIDECSMISQEMIIELKKYTELYPIKVIFMGDRKQLPPVGEKESLIFTNIPKNYHYNVLLDEIMRTNSPDIKEVCTIIRNWNKKDSLCKLLLPIHNKKSPEKTFKLYHKKENHLEATWFKNFIKKLDAGDIPIILTWTNPTSDKYNAMVRKYVHKSTNLNNYMVGDYAMFNNYYTSPEDGTCFYTSDMIKIINIITEERILFDWTKLLINEPKNIIDKAVNTMLKKISKHKNNFRIDIFTVEKIHSDVSSVIHGKTHIVETIHRDDLEEYREMLEYIQEHIEFFFKKYKAEQMTSRLWDVFHKKLIDPYAELNFGYSITTHKAQGSTFSTVIVDVQDISRNPDIDELQKALYTAAGRTANELGFLLE
ncbi:putative DNA helicase [Tupanvirus soda lake]|uniref:DNA helicase n=2 Tax=Tupanvirus TaxID=2094720 RepID=A0AC62ABI6_9VIRU|nr:putative DNA helicase [Tupanvirus soda lake]QKU34973.1 putative DNA helicase [Tupanvirus soda lake]